jgi:hypothetical protein
MSITQLEKIKSFRKTIDYYEKGFEKEQWLGRSTIDYPTVIFLSV